MTIDQTAVRQVWPLLEVRDIARSVEFYRDRLGFDLVGRAAVDGRLFWCRLERGGSCVMLQQQEEGSLGMERGRGVSLYFICDDADAMQVELSMRGLDVDPPSIAEYGMKQLFVAEPNGYQICFESPTEDWSG